MANPYETFIDELWDGKDKNEIDEEEVELATKLQYFEGVEGYEDGELGSIRSVTLPTDECGNVIYTE